MKVCVANLPWQVDDRTGIRAGCRFPNLTLRNTNRYVPFPFLVAYTAAYLESKGVGVLVIDGCAERCDIEEFGARLQSFQPDLLIVETSTTSLAYDLSVLGQLRARLGVMKVAIYGSHTDARPEDALLDEAVDFVMQGEPELTSYALVEALRASTPLNGIQGLAFRDEAGAMQVNARRPGIADLNDLPFPKRDGLPMDRYNVAGFPAPVAFLHGSRGCPFRCTFCLWPQTTTKGLYRGRSAENIADEMCLIMEQFPQTRSFFFDDDTFNVGRRSRLLELADELGRRNLRLPWGCNARADNWDREVLTRLRDSGLFTLRIGIESGDPNVLKQIKKDLDLDEARTNLKLADSLGIKNHLMFVIGLPGETEESVENTIAFIKSVPCHSVQFSVATPFPGTEFYRTADEQGMLVSNDWTKYNGFDHVVVRTAAMSADQIGRALARARRRVYFSPKFIKRRMAYIHNARDLGALWRKAFRLLVSSAYNR